MVAGDVVPIPGDMPIYDDPLVLIESIKKLMAFKETSLLLSSWDEPRTGSAIDMVMLDGVSYVYRLHNAVLEISKANPSISVVDLCKRILETLNLPMFMANPLVARSFTSSLRYL